MKLAALVGGLMLLAALRRNAALAYLRRLADMPRRVQGTQEVSKSPECPKQPTVGYM